MFLREEKRVGECCGEMYVCVYVLKQEEKANSKLLKPRSGT